MRLLRNQDSLAIVLVLYLQVFTSPFHKYRLQCTECQTINAKTQIHRHVVPDIIRSYQGAEPAVPLSSKLHNNNPAGHRILVRSPYEQKETIVVTDTGAPETPNRRKSSRKSNQRVTAETSSGTIVVGDDSSDTSSDEQQDRESRNYELNTKSYCDTLARKDAEQNARDGGLAHGAGPMYCVDYINCPSIEQETSSSRIRELTCGLKLDGTIRVCCRDFDRSSLSEEELASGRVVRVDETFNSEEDDGTAERKIDTNEETSENRHQVATPRQETAPTSSNSSNATATLVVGESQNLNTNNSSQRSPQATTKPTQSRESGGRELKQKSVASSGTGATSKKRPSYWKPEKFPKDCGLSQAGYNDQDELRIIGGKSAKRNAWPWFALLMIQRRRRFEPECGATLITNRHVLTAAHCVLLQGGKRLLPKHQLRVRLGEFNLRETGDGELDFNVEQVIAHKQFDPRTFKNDIAILKLSQNISQFNESIAPACLAGLDGQHPNLLGESTDSLDNHTVWVLGFGQTTYNGRTSDQLRQADLKIVPLGKCKRAFAHLVKLTPEYVCASSQYDTDSSQRDSAKPANRLKDSCQGDSGGPLMITMGAEDTGQQHQQDSKATNATGTAEVSTGGADENDSRQSSSERWYVYGIVSFGFKCAVPNFAGVYCRVNRYIDWIMANTEF